ncbi:MAG: TldD/PmbA family protein [Deltaproteobacteria bacterium]|nr:TldD/PmbA family protein [Deltaproteobacteria bacterium]
MSGLALARRALERAAERGAASADAVLVQSETHEVCVRGEQTDSVQRARQRCLGLRVFVASQGGLQQACASTSDLSEASVLQLAEGAVAAARASAPDPLAGLPGANYARELPDLALCEAADRGMTAGQRIEMARQAERAARGADPRIVNSEGSSLRSRFGHFHYANTDGFAGSYQSAFHALDSRPIAAENGAQQTDFWRSVARRSDELQAPEEVGRRAAQRALARLGARRIPTCRVPVIFDPLCARSLLANLAAALSGDAVCRQGSFLAGKLGETIACDALHITDDGRRAGGLGSRPFDGEGLPTRQTRLVEAGRLQSFLLDSYSARKLGLQSTGNALRGPSAGPEVAPTNLWIEPGTGDLEDLVRGTERGLLVTGLFGQGFNPVSGDFSRGASGHWIEGGERSHPVEEITVAGNLGEMLCAVDAVGGDLLWLGPIAAPSLRVASLAVAGA